MTSSIDPEIVAFAERFCMSPEYCARLSEKDRAMYVEMRPLPGTVHHESLLLRSLASGLKTIEDTIAAVGGVLDLNPDFQRGHVTGAADSLCGGGLSRHGPDEDHLQQPQLWP